MSARELERFIFKVNQLNLVVELIEREPEKRDLLERCDTHDQVVSLARDWGFEIGRRWGEE
ncbi:Nif11 family protein [Prochlorococcus sp. MIT 1341]|uniref:Nif11 family protein n=1 Tax=Prochlorococcus sp. MIT 1341 TaxID=3096221 RepID=UPI002A7592F7|nr:Nif11 family protein [Prochlorococcus sp. MIT 1341]